MQRGSTHKATIVLSRSHDESYWGCDKTVRAHRADMALCTLCRGISICYLILEHLFNVKGTWSYLRVLALWGLLCPQLRSTINPSSQVITAVCLCIHTSSSDHLSTFFYQCLLPATENRWHKTRYLFVKLAHTDVKCFQLLIQRILQMLPDVFPLCTFPLSSTNVHLKNIWLACKINGRLCLFQRFDELTCKFEAMMVRWLIQNWKEQS